MHNHGIKLKNTHQTASIISVEFVCTVLCVCMYNDDEVMVSLTCAGSSMGVTCEVMDQRKPV